MKYAIIQTGKDLFRDQIERDLKAELKANNWKLTSLDDDIQFILNFTDFGEPKAVHRKLQSEFVVSVVVLHEEVADLRFLGYNTLIKTLSNLLICIKPNGEERPEVYCITPEVGFYHFPYSSRQVYKTIDPIIHAHFFIYNQIRYDLPAAYHSTPITEKLKHYGRVLDELGILPTPYSLKQVLSPENIQHVYDLFNIRGLSYGNLSAREPIPEIGPHTYWMTARGVDKANLQGVGQDILLVEGYDMEKHEMLVRVPPGSNPKIRVSVDAIEHALIYQNYPEVGAIVHVHAWIPGVVCTRQNYPCGTIELANEVVSLLRTTPNPERAIIGLKNHGLTITGPSLEEIFFRIEEKLVKEVPMIA